MNRSTLFTALTALTYGVLATGCQRTTAPQHVTTLDSLRTSTNGALLTLRELDPSRYDLLDSAYHALLPSFLERLDDTLRPEQADQLVDRFLVFRSAERMGEDQRMLEERLAIRYARLDTLRGDLAIGALPDGQVREAIRTELGLARFEHEQVLSVIQNYRTAQQAWDMRDSLTALLSETRPTTARP